MSHSPNKKTGLGMSQMDSCTRYIFLIVIFWIRTQEIWIWDEAHVHVSPCYYLFPVQHVLRAQSLTCGLLQKRWMPDKLNTTNSGQPRKRHKPFFSYAFWRSGQVNTLSEPLLSPMQRHHLLAAEPDNQQNIICIRGIRPSDQSATARPPHYSTTPPFYKP